MRVFYDAEFVERGPQLPIQPVSFGFVAEDGRELYVINQECLTAVNRHPWCSVNLLPSLPVERIGDSASFIADWDRRHPEFPHVVPLDTLVRIVHGFLSATPDLELWAYYGAYDHVVLCQLFGSMADLPPDIPQFTHELQQLLEQVPDAPLPSVPGQQAHHALWDARWNAEVFRTITDILQQTAPEEDVALSVQLLDGTVYPASATAVIDLTD